MNGKRLEVRSPDEPPVVLRSPVTRKVLYGILAFAWVYACLSSFQSVNGTLILPLRLLLLDLLLGLALCGLVYLYLSVQVVYWAGRLNELRPFGIGDRRILIDPSLSISMRVSTNRHDEFSEVITLSSGEKTMRIYNYMTNYEEFCTHLHEIP